MRDLTNEDIALTITATYYGIDKKKDKEYLQSTMRYKTNLLRLKWKDLKLNIKKILKNI